MICLLNSGIGGVKTESLQKKSAEVNAYTF